MNYYKKFSFKKLINNFLSSTILLSVIPISINSSKALEFQWNQDDGYKRLKYYQKTAEKNFKNKIFFLMRSSDRKTGLISIKLKIPDNFKSTLKPKKITFCKAKIGGFTSRTKCLENITTDIVLNKETKRLEIYPISPIPSNKDTYAVVLKITNPRRAGLYQFHSFGQSSGPVPVTNYIGSWTIKIDP